MTGGTARQLVGSILITIFYGDFIKPVARSCGHFLSLDELNRAKPMVADETGG